MAAYTKKSGVKLDANGNLDPGMLEKELVSALEHDVRYKQQDNAKKKAVKVRDRQFVEWSLFSMLWELDGSESGRGDNRRQGLCNESLSV